MKQTGQNILQRGVFLALFYATLAGIAILSLVVENHHPHSWLEAHLPFFWSFFAFFAAIIIICLSKWLAKAGLEAKPGCYDLPLGPAEEKKP
ncbi:MAG: hypothetical protein HQQ73_08745 [Desulfobulbaceae bacterium]|nr:hypothetical protein [Desulfobulbaceae bacterium]